MMFNKLLAKIEVARVYSPARVTETAMRIAFKAGWALHITTSGCDGMNICCWYMVDRKWHRYTRKSSVGQYVRVHDNRSR